jgi:hypothetical protein
VTDDDIAGIVITAGALLLLVLFAFYWRQRLRFTRGAEPVMACAAHWWNGPLGLGWRQGFVKLGKDQLWWRRRLTFRSTATIVLHRSAITLLGRSRPGWDTWLWISSCDVLTIQTPERHLELGLLPDDADVLLDWLGTPVERPSARISQGISAGLWVVWLFAIVLFWGWKAGGPWIVAGILIAAVAVPLAGGLVLGLIRRRRLLGEAGRDEFVIAATEVFTFLQDFGFDDAYVQHFPWQTRLVFTGTSDRVVMLTNDRRAHSLELSMGHRTDEEPARLRDMLRAAAHPDPDRVDRYEGVDGPLRAALDANAHALRLWGRSFLTEQAARNESGISS